MIVSGQLRIKAPKEVEMRHWVNGWLTFRWALSLVLSGTAVIGWTFRNAPTAPK